MTSARPGPDDAALTALLTEWLPHQRWFSGKGDSLDAVTVTSRAVVARIGDAEVEQVLFTVPTTGGVDRYQLWVGWRATLADRLAPWAIGSVEGRVAYDALHDPEVDAFLLASIDGNAELGPLRARSEADVTIDVGAPGMVIGAEQSNTSVVYGHSAILKMFRRLEPGPNPDLEVHQALHRAGSTHIADLLGSIEGPVDGEPTTLGLLTAFFANSAEGWAMAVSSVRDLMAEGDLRADEVGGDFAAESYRLGEAVAAVHGDLAQSFGSDVTDRAGVQRTVDEMATAARAAAALVPALAEHLDDMLAVFGNANRHAAGIQVQRIHGDLHLGQCLRTLTGWAIIDFEGEPAKPLEYRRAMHSPLKDIAGMLRSFDYAAHHPLVGARPDAQQRYRATEWARRNCTSFCDGYAAVAGVDPRQAGGLLRAFELDKAVYEVVYEHGHRPHWEPIPLQAVHRLISGGKS